jgi:hypothetical protein
MNVFDNAEFVRCRRLSLIVRKQFVIGFIHDNEKEKCLLRDITI